MPQCCVVPNCKGNYKNQPKVHTFGFPRDQELRARWIHAIKRVDFKPTKNSRVCHLHFRPHEIIWETSCEDKIKGVTLTAKLSIPKLAAGAIPSQFPNCPTYFSSSATTRPSPNKRKANLEEVALQKALSASLEEKQAFDERINVKNFDDFNNRLSVLQLDANFWHIIKRPHDTLFLNLSENEVPSVKYSVVVKNDLHLHVFVGEEKLKKLGNIQLPLTVTDMITVDNILSDLKNISCTGVDKCNALIDLVIDILSSLNDENFEHEVKVKFILDQLHLLKQKKQGIRYTSELLIFSSLLFSVAPHAYRFLRSSGNLTLPHTSTIQRICSYLESDPIEEQQENNFLKYIKNKVDSLEQKDKTVILLMDEIHLKPFFDYKGGNIVGSAFDCKETATSAYVFMICSVVSKFKDVVHIAPTRTLNAHTLYQFIKKIIVNLEEAGFKIICIVSDNNSINRKAVSYFLPQSQPKSKNSNLHFVFPHPVNPTRPLFFLIDTVHLLKCIRNNWLNQKNPQRAMFFPPFPSNDNSNRNFLTASLLSLKELHDIEFESLLKYGYNLSRKALFPSNLERQNVRLVLQIFNEKIIEALKNVGQKHQIQNAMDTAEFIKIICTWWSIVNVKTPFIGKRLKNSMKMPLTNSDSDEKLQFLHHMLDWLDSWEAMLCDTGMFSRETHSALKITTNGLIELVSYCNSELNMDYILPGKFQTDDLEARFSLYRQLSGGQYNVSIRQVFECEKKIRTHSLLKLSLPIKNKSEVNIESVDIDWEILENQTLVNTVPAFTVQINDDDIENCNTILSVITYVAGYCIHSVMKRLKCEPCRQQFLLRDISHNQNQMIKDLDRGGLVYPEQEIVNVTLYTYIVVNKVLSEHENDFVKGSNQRQLIVNLTLDILKGEELIVEEECENGHCKEKVYKMVIWGTCNILLNNYCKTKNDLLKTDNVSKKRKLQTILKNSDCT